MGSSAAVLVLDVGNTSVHLALCDDASKDARPRVSWRADERSDSPAARDRALRAARSAGRCFEHAVVGSVHARAGEWVETLQAEGVEVEWFQRGAELGMPHRLRDPSGVGVDRMANALAAWQLFRAPTVVVDVGTAVTVDAVDDAGVFLGGAILPGRAASYAALHRATDRLPQLEPRAAGPDPVPLPGRDTEEAIRAGVERGVLAAIERLTADCEAQLAGHGEPILTGGDAEWLAATSHRRMRPEPDLTVLGLWWAARARAGE